MKKILIIADGNLAKTFIQRLFVSKSAQHHYIIISADTDFTQELGGFENFSFYRFDATSLSKLKSIAGGYFSQFNIITQSKPDALACYENLRKISTKTDINLMNLWEFDEKQKQIFSEDNHLSIVDVREIVASRLIDYMPDLPVVADNIGLSEGEIMEVKIPIGSSYMHRHINSIRQKKWRIALVYRSGEIILPKPSVMLLPNDTLLIVGDPKVLQAVYRSIKRETGQFPNPFGSNIYTLIDMRQMSPARVQKLIDDSIFLHSKLNGKRLFFKILNPTFGENLERLRQNEEKDIVVLFDYFSRDSSALGAEISRLDVGLVVTDDEYFFKFQRLFYSLKLPILKTGELNLSELKQGVILGEAGEEIENQSSVIMDCCTQLDMQVKFYHFDTQNNDNAALTEHFESLQELFSKRIIIESSNEKNPLVKLKNSEDLLHFVVFDKQIVRADAFAFLSSDMNRLYKKMRKNAQLFVPTSV